MKQFKELAPAQQILIAFGGFLLLVFASSILPSGEQRTKSKARSSPSPVTASPMPASCPTGEESGSWTTSAGSLWVNTKLYQGEGPCKRFVGTVLGGGRIDGKKTIRIQYPDGTIEDKYRDAVKGQTYVKKDDPAGQAKLWQEF